MVILLLLLSYDFVMQLKMLLLGFTGMVKNGQIGSEEIVTPLSKRGSAVSKIHLYNRAALSKGVLLSTDWVPMADGHILNSLDFLIFH